jgi:hypothetical protein
LNLKLQSTPRLMESNAAGLSKRGRKVIESEIRFDFEKVLQLVDSETVLSIINKTSTRLVPCPPPPSTPPLASPLDMQAKSLTGKVQPYTEVSQTMIHVYNLKIPRQSLRETVARDRLPGLAMHLKSRQPCSGL